MLPDDNRLKTDDDFASVKQGGKLYQKSLFGVLIKDRADDSPTRFGFIVSTKVTGEAVHRNRIKRAFREAVRHELSFARPGYDVVFLAKKATLRAMTEAIMKEVKSTLRDQGVLK